jgi:hypothetical protein
LEVLATWNIVQQIIQWKYDGSDDHSNIYLVIIGKDSINGLHTFQTTGGKFDTLDSLGPKLKFD